MNVPRNDMTVKFTNAGSLGVIDLDREKVRSNNKRPAWARISEENQTSRTVLG